MSTDVCISWCCKGVRLKNENRGRSFGSFISGNARDIPCFIVEMEFHAALSQVLTLDLISIHIIPWMRRPTQRSHPNRASHVLTRPKRVSFDRSSKWSEDPVIWGFRLRVSVVVDYHTAVLCVIKQRSSQCTSIQLLFWLNVQIVL